MYLDGSSRTFIVETPLIIDDESHNLKGQKFQENNWVVMVYVSLTELAMIISHNPHITSGLLLCLRMLELPADRLIVSTSPCALNWMWS